MIKKANINNFNTLIKMNEDNKKKGMSAFLSTFNLLQAQCA